LLTRSFAALLLASSLCSTIWAASDCSWVKSEYRKGDFKLVHGGRAADILVAPEVGIFPTTAPSVDPTQIARAAPVIEYRLQLFTTGRVNVACYLVPTHPIQAGRGLRYAVGFDDQPPQIVTVDEALTVPSRAWSLRVLNATTTGQTTLEVTRAGVHVLKIYMVDPGVILDKIVLNLGGLRPSYLGPPETKVTHVGR